MLWWSLDTSRGNELHLGAPWGEELKLFILKTESNLWKAESTLL